MRIKGKKYDTYKSVFERYDKYYYRGSFLHYQPPDTVVFSYFIDDDGESVGICRKSLWSYRWIGYGALGVAGAAIVSLGVLIFNADVEVPILGLSLLPPEEVIELDTGIREESKGLTYSQYVTYDGAVVRLFVKGRNNSTVAVTDGIVTSEFVPIADCHELPVLLDMSGQSAKDGTLLYKLGDTVYEYPLVIEYMSGEVIELPHGDLSDWERGYASMVREEVVETQSMQDSFDFENFTVIKEIDPDDDN